jgi:hypothetical protein
MAQGTTNRDQFGTESERAKESPSELVAQVARDSHSLPSWLSLDEHEELLWQDSPSFRTFLPNLVLNIIIIGIGVALVSIGLLQFPTALPSNLQLVAVATGGAIMIAGIGFLVVNYRSYQRRHYALTTEAIYRRWDGSTTRIEMTNTCEVVCEQSLLDRQFSCGDLKIGWSKNGTEKATYPAVPRPNQVKKRTSEVAMRQRKKL